MLVLIRWLARRRLATLHAWGALLGWLGYGLSPSYRRRLVRHAKLGGLDGPQRRAAVAQAGRMVAEMPWLWLRPPSQPLGDLVRWEGVGLIQAAIGKGSGLVLLTPHLGCFEVCAQAIAERFGAQTTLTAMYRPARQAWLRTLEETARNRPGLATTPATLSGVRQMIRALRQGQAVGLLPDQVPPKGMGVWAPFYGQQAYTMTLAARLVQQTGAVMLLIWAKRLPHGAGFEVHVTTAAPLPDGWSDAVALQVACAAAINADMQRLIAQCPEQYLWGYHRYKAPRAATPVDRAP